MNEYSGVAGLLIPGCRVDVIGTVRDEKAAQQIVISMDANNPGANPLREVLGRFGSSVTANPRMIPMASNDPGQQYAPPQPLAPVQSQPLSPVQSQSLPPPPPRY